MNAIVAGKQEKVAGSLVWKTDIVCAVNTTWWTCPSSYYETHTLKVTDTSDRTAYFRIYNFQGGTAGRDSGSALIFIRGYQGGASGVIRFAQDWTSRYQDPMTISCYVESSGTTATFIKAMEIGHFE